MNNGDLNKNAVNDLTENDAGRFDEGIPASQVTSRTDESLSSTDGEEKKTEEQLPMPATEEPVRMCGQSAFDGARARKNFSTIGFGLALFSFVTLLVSSVIMVAVRAIAPNFYSTMLFRHLVTPVSLYIFALPVLLLVFSRVEARPPEKRKMGFGKWMLFLIVAFGLLYMGAEIGNVVSGILTAIFGLYTENSVSTMIGESELLLNFIFVVIVAPIGEEFVFRKLIIDRTGKYGCLISALFSGLTFGLMHGNFYQFFYAFALGLLMGYMYYHTGKLHLTVAVHAVINFVGGILSSLLSERLYDLLEALENLNFESASWDVLLEFVGRHGLTLVFALFFLLFQTATTVCAIVLPIVLRKHIVLEKGEVVVPKGKMVSTVFLNVGVIVMLLIYAAEFVINLIPS